MRIRSKSGTATSWSAGSTAWRLAPRSSAESMVSRQRDASKVALAWLVARLKLGGFTLLDCQFQTDHLASLGVIEVPRDDYVSLLSAALGAGGGVALGAPAASGDFFALDRAGLPDPGPDSATVFGPPTGKVIAQLLAQTS